MGHMATTTLPWQPSLPLKLKLKPRYCHPWLPTTTTKTTTTTVFPSRHVAPIRAFQRSDIDGFAKRMVSGEALKDAWRSANDGFEQFLYEAKKAAEQLDRRYSVSRRVSSVARSAADRAREIDREFEIGMRWRTFSLDFTRNLPRVCSLSLSLSSLAFVRVCLEIVGTNSLLLLHTWVSTVHSLNLCHKVV